jgi:gentisate 1,2-dioxygenase
MPDDLAPRGFFEGLSACSLMAGWARREQHIGPKSEMHVHVWRAAEARIALQEASRFVGTDVAERRNLIMVNPAPGNTYATTRNIVAAYQMIQPGETARSHRHTPAALRLVLDAADDVYTVVDGKRVDMAPGDVVLTPSWCWHGHANDGSETAFWAGFPGCTVRAVRRGDSLRALSRRVPAPDGARLNLSHPARGGPGR